MEKLNFKEKYLTRPLHRERIPFWIVTIYGILNAFVFFIPFVYTDVNGPVFVNGFSMFTYLQDSGSGNLYYGTAMMLFGYIMGGFCFLLGLLGLFVEQEKTKYALYFTIGFPLLKFGCELYSIIALGLCSKMGIHLEMGFFLDVIFSFAITVFEIVFVIQSKLKKTK